MKKYLIAAALIAVPNYAVAAEDANVLDGFISASVGYQDNGNDFGGITPTMSTESKSNDASLAVRGTIAVPLAPNIALQADLSYAQEPVTHGVTQKSTSIASHLFYRGAGNFLVGAIGQVNFNQFGIYANQIDTKQYFIGGEAQAKLNNFTLTAQVAYRKDDSGFVWYGTDGIATTAQAKYFINPNWSLGVKGEYAALNYNDVSADLDQWRIGLTTERRLTSAPVSLIAKIAYGETKVETVKFNDTRIMGGIKFNFGSQTLTQRDDNGASLDPFESSTLSLAYDIN